MPGVLYLVHGLPPEENTGTPLVTDGYARGLVARGRKAAVVYASLDAAAWSAHPLSVSAAGSPRVDGVVRVAVPHTPWLGENWSIEAPSVTPEDDATSIAAFSGLLEVMAPDIVHVVDNVHLPLAWPEVAHDAGIPVVRTVSCAEDLCGMIAPVSTCSGPDGYCEAPLTPQWCATCITSGRNPRYTWPGHVPGSGSDDRPESKTDGDDVVEALLLARRRLLLEKLEVKRRRAQHQFCSVFDRVVFSSEGFRQYFCDTLPLDPSRVSIVEMGLDTHEWPPRPAHRPSPDEPLVFCLAATLDGNKGHGEVTKAFTSDELIGRDDYRLVLLGDGDSDLVADLSARNSGVRRTGAYSPHDLPRLLSGVHVGLSTSHFETFHRVTREYFLAGLPVVANNTFGIRDIVVDGHNGLLYRHADSQGLTRAVVSLLDDRALYHRLAEGARATTVRSLDDELDDLISIYDDLAGGPSAK